MNAEQTSEKHNSWVWPVIISVLVLAGFGIWRLSARQHQHSAMAQVQNPQRAQSVSPPILSAFRETIPNSGPAQGQRPEGMVWISGGEFSMGVEDPRGLDHGGHDAMEDARPIHRVRVDGFWIDKTEVTNEQFEKFVKATGYLTIAERKPRAEDFPDAPPENLIAGSIVFAPPDHPVPLDNQYQWWNYVAGANWRHPTGSNSSIQGREKFPVVQIAYDDAQAYAKWARKRLPTEAEWEFAARGGLSGKRYAWGDDFEPNGKWMANTFQGDFPIQAQAQDGFAGLAPVAQYPPNGYGLYDVAGNVWEWCADWYRPDSYFELAARGGVVSNPQGPDSSYDPSEPDQKKRVQRGGSFLCTDQYCARYIIGTRGKGEASTGTNHVGFRCVTAENPTKASSDAVPLTQKLHSS